MLSKKAKCYNRKSKKTHFNKLDKNYMTDESDGSDDGFHKHPWRSEGKFNIDLIQKTNFIFCYCGGF